MARILLVDDDVQSIEPAIKILAAEGHQVTHAIDGESALEQIRSHALPFEMILTDVRMPRLDGLQLMKALSVLGNDVPIVVMTAFGRVDEAVEAMKLGAVDFLSKPFKKSALVEAVKIALGRVIPRKGPQGSAAEIPLRRPEDAILGVSAAMQNLRRLVSQAGATQASVLLRGESGTGKELVARALHQLSDRASAPFVPLNCAAIPDSLIESELFGHEKGAFSGATQARAGLFHEAHRGTLFLDEIGDMPLNAQAKLLRTLQEGEVRSVGSNQSERVDVRVIAATHRDLRQRVKEGLFREDLLFRLEVIEIVIPPLRERPEDLDVLVAHSLLRIGARHGRDVQGVTAQAMAALRAHSWPGNVRELMNVLERATVFTSREMIDVGDLPPHLAATAPRSLTSSAAVTIPLGTPLREVEDLLIRKTLEATDGDKNLAARMLGINSRTVYRRLEKPDQSSEQ